VSWGRWLAAALAASLAAGAARAEPRGPAVSRPSPRLAGAGRTPAPARPPVEGRALLLARLPAADVQGVPLAPGAQTMPLPQPVPLSREAIEDPKPLDRWWFWAAAGGLVLATAALFLVVTRGGDQPSTRLGNMEAFD
jgi:hypothetical protein